MNDQRKNEDFVETDELLQNNDLIDDEIQKFIPKNRILKYENKMFKEMHLPQEARLFCLVFNSIVVEYEEENKNDDNNLGEKDVVLLKEIHSFS